MSMIIATSLRNLEAFLKDHQMSFYNGLLIFFTIAGEQIFKVSAYKCPCKQPEAFYYGLVFFVCPAVILWILGVAVSNLTWRICHGCWGRKPGSENGFCKSASHLLVAAARAAVVPTAWLFVTFLDGNYYSCMLARDPCNTTSDEFRSLQATSQNIGWLALVALVTITFIVIWLIRCCDSVTYYYYKYLSSYQESEQKHMDIFLQEKAEKHAKDRIRIFAECEIRTKLDWDTISKSPDLQVPGKCSTYASHLDKWASGKKLNKINQQSQGVTLVNEAKPNEAQHQQSGNEMVIEVEPNAVQQQSGQPISTV